MIMDDIVKVPDELAERAHDAIRAYVTGVVKLEKGRAEVIAAIVEYGRALLEGRKRYGSNDEFGKWVIANKLDRPKPFDQMRDRNAAQLIAEMFILRNAPEDAFSACNNTRPDDIMKWARKQPWFVRKPSPVKAAKPSKRTKRGRPRKDEKRPQIIVTPKITASDNMEEHQRWVDPEFKGTPMEWTLEYGHVQVMTAEQYNTERFAGWTHNLRQLAVAGKKMEWPRKINLNWLRSPKPRDIVRLTEALDYFRPIIMEMEAALEKARQTLPVESPHQPAGELLPNE
jgi:hypothetical protein